MKRFWLIFNIIFLYCRIFESITPYVTKVLIPLLTIWCIVSNNKSKNISDNDFNSIYTTYSLLFVVSLVSFFVCVNIEAYLAYNQMMLGIICISLIIRTKNLTFKTGKDFIIGFIVATFLIIISSRNIEVENTNSAIQQAGGIVGNANTYGSIVVLGSFLSFVGFKMFNFKLTSYFIINILYLMTLLDIGSRSSIIGFLTIQGLFIYSILIKNYKNKSKNLLKFAIILTLTCSYLLAFKNVINLQNNALSYRLQLNEINSDYIRLNLFKTAWNVFLENPIIGVGAGNFIDYNSLNLYTHNDFLEIISTLGLFGIIVYMIFIVKIHNYFRQLGTPASTCKTCCQAFLIIYIMQGLFKPLYLDILWMYVLFFMLTVSRNVKTNYCKFNNSTSK